MRNLGFIGALLIALLPHPAQAQGDFIKGKLTHLIQKAGIYVSASAKGATDSNVDVTQSIGISPGLAGTPRRGKKYPFSFSTYSADFGNGAPGDAFGHFKAKQLLSGIGYQWAPTSKLLYAAQLGIGYSFNSFDTNAAAASLFNAAGPVEISVSNSWVLRPQLKVEYFVRPKISIRTQGGYLYTDPHVVVQTPTGRIEDNWRPSHFYFSVGMGFFPLRK